MADFNPLLTQAGRFKVNYDPCPQLNRHVLLNSPRAGVLHTTEGGMSEDIFHRHWSPHFVVGKGIIHQHVPIGFIGASLENHNDLAIVQIELAGYSSEKPWLPDSESLEALASLMLECRRQYGIPLTHPWPDGTFGQYGYHTQRRASGKFGSVAGWFGHGDVPDNKHWDPGNLEWHKVFDRAKAIEDEQHLPAILKRVETGKPAALSGPDEGFEFSDNVSRLTQRSRSKPKLAPPKDTPPKPKAPAPKPKPKAKAKRKARRR